eukprot:XP_016661032.1 PREDICTED: uncharacterized protein LOC107884083 [Acyrthosiphon pisum]
MKDQRCATITSFGLSGFFELQYPYFELPIANIRRIYERYDNIDRCSIETLYVRNYPKVTDELLKAAVRSSLFLKLLDITGSSCTSAKIENFKAKRPSTKVIC